MSIDLKISNNSTEKGVQLGYGDGTVRFLCQIRVLLILSLLSTGYMCNRGWGFKRYNPSNMTVTTVELPHKPAALDIRGGPASAEHVSILGSSMLNELILKVAAGKGHDIQTSITSDILEISQRVDIPP